MISADELKAFYSWQSDLPETENRNFIKGVLEDSIKKLNKSEKIKEKIRIDESLANTSGSPDIKSTVLHKIENSSFFIADVSICSKNEKGKYFSNSNVMFELGYAVAHLGWNRIILLINGGICKPEELPFDIRGHGVLSYRIEDRKPFVNQMKKKFEEIYYSLPISKNFLDEDKIRRRRDIDTLTQLFCNVNFNNISLFLDKLPNQVHQQLFVFFDVFAAIFSEDPTCHLYDKSIKKRLINIYKYYSIINKHSHLYSQHNKYDNLWFLSPDKKIYNKKSIKMVEKASLRTKENIISLLNIIKESYLEINLNDCFSIANSKLNNDFLKKEYE